MNPANNIIGMTVKLSTAPPVIKQSVKFIATSILIIEIKELLMDGVTDYEDVDCYIGEKPCQHEGYVMTNKYGTYKLVKREIFSYNNFNATKNWSK